MRRVFITTNCGSQQVKYVLLYRMNSRPTIQHKIHDIKYTVHGLRSLERTSLLCSGVRRVYRQSSHGGNPHAIMPDANDPVKVFC